MTLSILPLLMVLAVYPKLPELVPMHWEINGTSAEYGEKWMLLPLGAVSILMTALLWIVPKIDPRKENYRRFENAYFSICVVLNVFFMAVMGMVLTESLFPGTLSVPKAASALCALLFIFMGNQMPKIKSNFSTGFKTPWALSSEEVWNKTQRLGGRLFVLGGLAILAGCFFVEGKELFVGMMGIVLVILLLPTVMSWRWYQQEQEEKRG